MLRRSYQLLEIVWGNARDRAPSARGSAPEAGTGRETRGGGRPSRSAISPPSSVVWLFLLCCSTRQRRSRASARERSHGMVPVVCSVISTKDLLQWARPPIRACSPGGGGWLCSLLVRPQEAVVLKCCFVRRKPLVSDGTPTTPRTRPSITPSADRAGPP